MQGIHKDRCSVRRPYAVHSFVSAFFFGCLFSCVVPGSFAVLSRFSSFPQILGLSESRRQSPDWHSLDGNLPIWTVRGCPLVVRRAHPGWKPFHLFSGSSSTSQSRLELLGSAAQPGPPFFLDNAVYASCSSSSPGALRQLPWGTQDFFFDTLNEKFSFRKEVRSWSRSC